MRKVIKENNQGFSLVELLVVIAIIGILFGIGVVGFRWIEGKPALKCAHMITSSLQESQAISMEKYETAIQIRRTPNGNLELCQVYKDTADAEPVSTTIEIGDANIDLVFITDAGEYEISSTQSLTLFFNRTTGGLLPLDNLSEYCVQIEISKAGTKKTIQIAPLTGSISLK